MKKLAIAAIAVFMLAGCAADKQTEIEDAEARVLCLEAGGDPWVRSTDGANGEDVKCLIDYKHLKDLVNK